MSIDWTKFRDQAELEIHEVLLEELGRIMGLSDEGREEVRQVAGKLAGYWEAAEAAVTEDAHEAAERMMRHAEALMGIIVAEYSIAATRGARATAQRVAREVGKIGLGLLTSLAKAAV